MQKHGLKSLLIILACFSPLMAKAYFTNQRATSLEAIAYRYAPIILVSHTDPSDYIVKLNYDGDYDLKNNHDKEAPDDRNGVSLYFDVSETTNFYAISYMIYHERESKASGHGNHIHDSESVLEIIDKQTKDILLFSTNSHSIAINSPGNSKNTSKIKDMPDIDTKPEEFQLFAFHDGNAYEQHHKDTKVENYISDNHPVIAVVSGSHSIYRSSLDNLTKIKNAVLYFPQSGASHISEDLKTKGIKYSLISLSNVMIENGLKKAKGITVIDDKEDINKEEIFDKYFNRNFFSTKKGQLKWQKTDGSIGILPTHFAQPKNEEQPEADIPLLFTNLKTSGKPVFFVLRPDEFLQRIGFPEEKLIYSTYDILPSIKNTTTNPAPIDPVSNNTNRTGTPAKQSQIEEFNKAWSALKSRGKIGIIKGKEEPTI